MAKMADTVLKKSNAAEKELEQRVLQYAQEKDQRAEAEENRRKKYVLDRNNEIKKTLDRQLEEKNKLKQIEQLKNKEYVAQVIAKDEKDRADQKEKDRNYIEKMKAIQKFQKMQMGEVEASKELKYNPDAGSLVVGGKQDKAKRYLDGPMNNEEIKMNRQLLQEIGQLKKQLGDKFPSNQASPVKSVSKSAL